MFCLFDKNFLKIKYVLKVDSVDNGSIENLFLEKEKRVEKKVNNKEQEPFFSIIIPVYKVEEYLDVCVSSVLSQSFGNFEIVLVDDGSPDKCPELCVQWTTKDNRVKVLHKTNGGLSSARNAGLKIARGEYVLFLDSDDYWSEQNLLSSAYDFLLTNCKNNDIDVILFQAKKYIESKDLFIPDKRYVSDEINKVDKNGSVKYLVESQTFSMSACTKIIKKSILLEKNVWFKDGLLGEDLDWFFLLLFSIENIYAIDNCCYVYRMRDGSITHSIGKKNIEDSLYIIDKWSSYIHNCSLDAMSKKCYLSILAYAQVTNMLNYNMLERFDKKALLKDIKRYCYLLKFGVNKRVKYTYLVYRLSGFYVTSKCLSLYSKIIK